MSNSKSLEVINEQIKYELYSAYLYLSMSAYFSDLGLPGFAHWLSVQAQEEVGHGTKLYNFIISRGGRAKLLAIEEPPLTWKSPLEVMEESLKHEKFVTSRINMLMDVALKEKDHASSIFLQWFVTEQVEEEENFTDLVTRLKFIKNDGPALLAMDKELAARVFTPVPGSIGAPATATE